MTNLSLEQIYQDYYTKVTHLVMKKVGDQNAVEDLVSDIFVKISNNLERYDASKAALSTWIYTIANNYITDYYRTRKMFEVLPDDNGAEGTLPDCLIDDSRVDQNLLMEEQLSELADALQKLKEKERDLIILYYYKEMTLKEIAEVLGMSYANTKVIHKKALGKLALLLAEE